jgi:spermidine synthase
LKEPDENVRFSKSMTPHVSRSARKAYKVIVDIGGGQGALLAAILAQHAGTRGILFDLPHVVVKAKELLAAANVADRCEIVGGDVFKSAPKGGDAYLIKSVLMDERDDSVVSILGRLPLGDVIVSASHCDRASSHPAKPTGRQL